MKRLLPGIAKRWIFIMASLAFAFGCKKDSDTTRVAIFNVAPTLAYSGAPPPASTSNGALPYLKVTESGRQDTILIYKGRIQGFTYEEGYKYALRVQITNLISPPADGHSENYQLLDIISKEKSN